MAKEYKIPLDEMLRKIDEADENWFENLDEEQQKEFSPWLVQRWAVSVPDNNAVHFLTMINDYCNRDFSIISKHPNLFWKLVAMSGMLGIRSGRKGWGRGCTWVPPGKGIKKNKIQKFLSKIYPTYKLEDINMLEQINSTDELKDLARMYGHDEKEIKELFK